MRFLVIAVSGAGGFWAVRHWPQLARQDVKHSPGRARAVTTELAPSAEDLALLEFARSLAGVEASGLGALYASLPGHFGPGRVELAQRLVWLRWAEAAPLEALAWLKANAPNDVPMFLLAWSESDPAAAWRATSDCVQARPALLRALSERLEREPPEAAIAILEAFPDEAMAEGDFVITRDAESLYAAAFHKFAAAEPVRALERALELTGVRRAAALAGVAAARAEKNSADALEWARSMADEADRKAALGAVIVDLSRRDPEAAGALLKETNNPFESTTGGSGPGTIILRRMSKDNPALAYAWASRHATGNDLNDAAGQLITQAVMRAHPRELPAIVASIENKQVRSQAIQALDNYANPVALPELAEGAAGLPPGAERDAILRAIFRGWADESPEEALVRARALPAGPLRDGALAATTEKLLSRHPDSSGMIEAINSLPESVRPQMHERWMGAIAESSPDQAAARLGEITDSALHWRAAVQIAESWMQIDTPAALAFVETLPASERTPVFRRVFARWAAVDPGAVTGWIAARPPGDDRDAAIGAFIEEGGKHGENEAAFRWSLELSESANRQHGISVSTRNLVRQDRELAIRLTSEANLTAAERTMVDALVETPAPPAK